MACGCAAIGGCRTAGGENDWRVPYGNTIGDRLWMWGHHPMSFASLKGSKEFYNLPYGRRIDMAEACRQMGIPGCFIVRWRNLPETKDLPEYMKQFRDTKRVGFSITDSAKDTFQEKVRIGLEYADRMPNLTTLIMDDFWNRKEYSRSIEEIEAVRAELAKRNMRLGIVLYADHNGVKSEFKPVLDLCDEITFWFWHGKNTGGIEMQVDALRRLAGDSKPVLLGQYMWDFGGKKPMPGEAMENQLAQASRLLASKAVHGVIFHCTPLVDMDLDAVRISREWIRENSPREWGV